MPTIEHRKLLTMAILLLVTCGLYFLYWLYQTKEEINKLGGTIPTFWFAILPFFNIYFLYRYAQDFVTYIRRKKNTDLVVLYLLLLLLLPFVAPFILQNELNNFAHQEASSFRGKLKKLLRIK